jgi:hypothetical protein
MIYDPKKHPEPVQAPRQSPRGKRSDGDSSIAERDGQCVHCRKPYWRNDVIVISRATSSAMPIHGSESQSDGWHSQCWNDAHDEG